MQLGAMLDDPDATESEDEAVAKGPGPTVKGAYSEDGLKQAVPKQDSASEPARPRPVGPGKGRRNGAEEGEQAEWWKTMVSSDEERWCPAGLGGAGKKRGGGRSKNGAKTTKRKEEAASEGESRDMDVTSLSGALVLTSMCCCCRGQRS